MMVVPEPLAGYDLLKVYGPEMECDHPGKQPVGSARSGPFYSAHGPEIRRWIERGGNVGLPLTGPLVAFDVDRGGFTEALDDTLPPTFTTLTGSGGEHRVYRCPEWETNRQITVGGEDWGSIRTGGWQVVVPPSVHPNGNRYRVLDDRKIATVDRAEIEAVFDAIPSGRAWREAAPGRPAGGVGGRGPHGADVSLPEEYPGRDADVSTCRRWLESNGLLNRLKCIDSGDRSGDEYVVAKCLAEGGFSPTTIHAVLDCRPDGAKWHEAGKNYRRLTVQKAIEAACDDPHVTFSEGA